RIDDERLRAELRELEERRRVDQIEALVQERVREKDVLVVRITDATRDRVHDEHRRGHEQHLEPDVALQKVHAPTAYRQKSQLCSAMPTNRSGTKVDLDRVS